MNAAVQEAGARALQRPVWISNVDEDQKRIRELFAFLIEAEPQRVAIMPSTAFAISLAASNIRRTLSPGKKGRILVLQDQMCSAIYPWQQMCDASNGDIILDIIQHPTNDGGWTEAIIKKLNEDVLVACLPPLHWADGALVDLEKISSVCQKQNINLIVDATQGILCQKSVCLFHNFTSLTVFWRLFLYCSSWNHAL